ncbi:MAG: class I SAM-dependent methyltransferase [Planctomyces sp.]|nr:class I SAM-dependent methyltransferase [Planctomyces sp.]
MGSVTRIPDYYQITECTESYFERLGDSSLGMGWPNIPDARRRFQVMLDVFRPEDRVKPATPVRLLDLGCGTGHLYQYLRDSGSKDIEYAGIDLSEKFIQTARSRHPEACFRQLDVLRDGLGSERFDYVVINGVFTSRCAMSFEVMWEFVQNLTTFAFQHADQGIAFNAMSKHVDWERDDLFHLPLDLLASFICRSMTRNFVIRNDYGLYEFTTYVYRERIL